MLYVMAEDTEQGKGVESMDELLSALRERLAADVECPRCGEVECTFRQCRDLD